MSGSPRESRCEPTGRPVGYVPGVTRPLLRFEELDRLGSFYHSWDSFGIAVPHEESGTKGQNQRTKEGPICAFLQLAIERSRVAGGDGDPSVFELFCADGYYAAHARRMGAGTVQGADMNKKHVRKANAVFDVLYGERPFAVADVLELVPGDPYDVVLCCGGLYHLREPASLLAACLGWTRGYLVVQTVVSLDHEGEPDYFESPAPGLSRGSRFSAQWLEAALGEAGWEVLDSHRNLNPGCAEQRDAGSIFALCRPRSGN